MSDDVPYWLRAEREAREAEVELLKKIIDEERVKFLEENGTLIAQKFQATHERDEARALVRRMLAVLEDIEPLDHDVVAAVARWGPP